MEQTDILRRAVGMLERLNVPYLVVGSIAGIARKWLLFLQHVADSALQTGGFEEPFPRHSFPPLLHPPAKILAQRRKVAKRGPNFLCVFATLRETIFAERDESSDANGSD